MLNIKNLSIYLENDLRLLLADFSFTLNPGDKAVLIGEEGNGKSTILKAIYDRQSISSYASIRGTIATKGEVIGYLPQQKDFLHQNLRTSDYLDRVVGYENLDYGLAYQLIDDFRLPDYLGQNPVSLNCLSGGELVKFLLMVELLKKPTMLLLDELSNDLDFAAVAWLENFIAATALPVMFISHDLRLIERCANVIIHLEQLKNKTESKHTIARMDYDDYRSHYYDNIDRQSQIASKQKEEYQKKFDRYNQVYQRVNHELNSVSRQLPGVAKNLKDKMHAVKSQGKRLEKQKAALQARPDFEEAINIVFPKVTIPQGKKVLDFQAEKLEIGGRVLANDVRLVVTGGQKVALVGPNGSGKTTLLKQINQSLQNHNLKVGYMPQNYRETLDENSSPVDFVASNHTREGLTQARTFLGSCNFTRDEMNHPIQELSGGQKAKLFFLKMIFAKCEVLLLDEPTRNLSPLSTQALIKALQAYQGVIIGVSHDRVFLEEIFCEFYLLDGSLALIDRDDYLGPSND